MKIKREVKCGHPERPYFAKEKCKQCYKKDRRRRISDEMVTLIKVMRKNGLGYKKIADSLGIPLSTIQMRSEGKDGIYHVKSRERQRVYWRKHKEERMMADRKWRKKNPERYKRSVCLSLARAYLRMKIITKEDLEDVIRGHEE